MRPKTRIFRRLNLGKGHHHARAVERASCGFWLSAQAMNMPKGPYQKRALSIKSCVPQKNSIKSCISFSIGAPWFFSICAKKNGSFF